jgi:hypothetical protein
MNRSTRAAILAACVVFGVGSAAAQDAPQTYIFGEYYGCDQNREAFADSIVARDLGPVYQKHVDAGHLQGWGWMSHIAGGHWRRALYYAASDLSTLLDTRNQIIEETQAGLAEASREFTSICSEHDDLLWSSVAGSTMGQQIATRSGAVYSTYMLCDISRQDRADEIMKQLIAPEIEKLVAAGEIASWSWNAHVIGGEFRRLLTHAGKDHQTLIAAVNKYNEAAGEVDEARAREFSEICRSHVDYLWNMELPRASE